MTTVLRGVGVSPGRRAAPAARMAPAVAEPAPSEALPESEREAAVEAITAASHQVREDLLAAAASASGTASEILTVTSTMATDPSLIRAAEKRVRDDGDSPEWAVWQAADALAEQLLALGGNLAERATDVRDVRARIVARLTGVAGPGVPVRDEPYILVAHDLAPADTATLDADAVLAIVTSGGGPTSHTSILARSLGIPCVVAVSGADDIADGDLLAVDGGAGEIHVAPDDALVERFAAAIEAPSELTGPGATKDSHRVALLANIGDPAGAAPAAEAGAEGVGLFRTEFCFLGRDTAPSIEEQVSQYTTVLEAFPGKKVVIRTLDAGADKPLPFVTADDEPNPALGVRGLRTSWERPEVLEDQLNAIAQAAAATSADVHVMAPMVATVAEAQSFVDTCASLGIEQAGIMIEIPAAALRARDLLKVATFASVGTNDLTQYALAADRELASLAELSTPWQPAVLDLIAVACEGAAGHDRPVGVCGEAAADPALAPVLVGLGVASLSMTARSLPAVGAVLATLTWDECRALAEVAREAPSAHEARARVRERIPALEEWGL
ncbi:phosphoenolpyruvate--protein phosphotransferase [Demequina globuliformis]|uniref:phosphoenolpyruvate--protein phosphotransferase n=1 Tax=Demequina globuliformis TaxID=676202 RepID=UPI0009FC0BBE|nr:phosphoenolpyruvate--protein phosphotransferase [Demequina globuliformis]